MRQRRIPKKLSEELRKKCPNKHGKGRTSKIISKQLPFPVTTPANIIKTYKAGRTVAKQGVAARLQVVCSEMTVSQRNHESSVTYWTTMGFTEDQGGLRYLKKNIETKTQIWHFTFWLSASGIQIGKMKLIAYCETWSELGCALWQLCCVWYGDFFNACKAWCNVKTVEISWSKANCPASKLSLRCRSKRTLQSIQKDSWEKTLDYIKS